MAMTMETTTMTAAPATETRWIGETRGARNNHDIRRQQKERDIVVTASHLVADLMAATKQTNTAIRRHSPPLRMRSTHRVDGNAFLLEAVLPQLSSNRFRVAALRSVYKFDNSSN